MHHGQKLELGACTAVLTQRLVVRVVVPGYGVRLRRESEHHHTALARITPLKGHGVVIVGKERPFMALEYGEKALLVLSVGIGIVHREVGDDINRNVRHSGSPY